jgi:hypothetical protein
VKTAARRFRVEAAIEWIVIVCVAAWLGSLLGLFAGLVTNLCRAAVP